MSAYRDGRNHAQVTQAESHKLLASRRMACCVGADPVHCPRLPTRSPHTYVLSTGMQTTCWPAWLVSWLASETYLNSRWLANSSYARPSQDTTISMGPTSIIPGSYLCGVNREGFFHSEDRIREELLAPQTLEGWKAVMTQFPENSDLGVRVA